MDTNTLEEIHRHTVALMHEANEQISSANDKFWYNGEFYTGSLNPEILFVGYNPGYGRDDWLDRLSNYDDLQQPFKLKEIKYIAGKEENERLAQQIYFMLQANFENPESFLRDKVAETNLIHFNTPDIATYNQSIKLLDSAMQDQLMQHFIHSFQSIIDLTHPKLILINGKSTYDQLKKRLSFTKLEMLETNQLNHLICARTVLNLYTNVNVLVTKHLSSPISDGALGSIGTFLKQMLEE